MTRVLVLVDGFHTDQLLASLGHLIPLGESQLLLVYVRGLSARAGLELATHRPGGHRHPPERERAVTHAEEAGAETALREAAELAERLTHHLETKPIRGEPGRAICDLALDTHAELIAMRASTPLGPVARFVADHSPCAVLLLPGRSRG